MPGLQDLLQRWGFVKLRRYGLDLTADGRIVSTRPVLNDGTGSRIVGWREGDVSIWKLSSWADAPRSSTTDRVAVPPVPVATRSTAAVPAEAPTVTAPPLP